MIHLFQLTYEMQYEKLLKFQPNIEVIHTFSKSYWMPALKCLLKLNPAGEYMSPLRGVLWENRELTADCSRYYYPVDHDAPDETCTCGIYATASLYDLAQYVGSHTAICLIEPFPDTKVIQGEHGWRCGHAFISEILNGPDQTIDIDVASQILERAWGVPFDLKRFNDALKGLTWTSEK